MSFPLFFFGVYMRQKSSNRQEIELFPGSNIMQIDITYLTIEEVGNLKIMIIKNKAKKYK